MKPPNTSTNHAIADAGTTSNCLVIEAPLDHQKLINGGPIVNLPNDNTIKQHILEH